VFLNLFDVIVNDQTKLDNCGVDVIIEIPSPRVGTDTLMTQDSDG
jgi:hypothetical protein